MASVLAFGAVLGLTALDVVGVTAHAQPSAASADAIAPAPVLAPGDFFGMPQSDALTPAVPPVGITFGGGPPMLTSSGS